MSLMQKMWAVICCNTDIFPAILQPVQRASVAHAAAPKRWGGGDFSGGDPRKFKPRSRADNSLRERVIFRQVSEKG